MADIARALRQRDADKIRAVEMQATMQPVGGFITINGPGQALFDISFPVIFTEKPLMSSPGYDLADGQVLDPSNYPTLNMGVHYFTSQEHLGILRYTGARIIIVATGHDGMIMHCHYRFEGTSLVNPTKAAGGVT